MSSPSAGIVLGSTTSQAITLTDNDTPPTTANASVTLAEDTVYSFGPSNFAFTDTDAGDTLQGLRITQRPIVGQLFIDTDSDSVQDVGEAVTVDQDIAIAALGQLTFRPAADANGTPYASFQFQVSDGRFLSSAPGLITLNVTPANDVPTGTVTITGTTTQGQTLTASNTLADVDGLGSISYAWLADGTSTGTTGTTYTLTQTDVGKVFTVVATYTDGFGQAESVTSAPTAVVLNLNDSPTGDVTLSGIGQESYTLTADATTVQDIDGLGAFSYQWQQSADGTIWSNIDGATGTTLLLTTAQTGQRVRAEVSYLDGGKTHEVVASTASEVIRAFSRSTNFNGDLSADIPWRHRTAGSTAVWFMNGITFNNTGSALPPVEAGWELAAVADFDGDQDADLLWQHQTTGQAKGWTMQGATLVQEVFFPFIGEIGWDIVGTGDFNGDAQADILWRNTLSGANAVWLMQGTNILSPTPLSIVPEQDWVVGAVGDFTKNGQMEILWQHRLSGEIALWLMNGTTLTGGSLIDQVDPRWRLVGAADFSGDAKLDLLWQHRTSDQIVIWQMDGLTRTGASLLSSPPPDWQAVI